MKNDSPQRRVSALNFFNTFCTVTTLDFSIYRPDWVRALVSLMDDRQQPVVLASVSAFTSFLSTIEKDDVESLVVTLRRTIESTGSLGRTVPGFEVPNAIKPMVPVIIAGLTTGSNEQREQAAYAIGDLVERTSEVGIKPYVVSFTGPLIRVATQAAGYPPGVKVAILKSLAVMLDRIPQMVKPFFPQLQRTFVKSVGDGSSMAVRNAAAKGLGVLMRSSQTRVDPLIVELLGAAKGGGAGGEEDVQASFVLALANVVKSCGGVVSAGVRENVAEVVEEAFRESYGGTFPDDLVLY